MLLTRVLWDSELQGIALKLLLDEVQGGIVAVRPGDFTQSSDLQALCPRVLAPTSSSERVNRRACVSAVIDGIV